MAFLYFALSALATAATSVLLYVFAREPYGARPAPWITGPYGKYPFAEAPIVLGWLLAYFLSFRSGNGRGPAGWYRFLSGVASGWVVWIWEDSIVGLPAVLLYL
ncbi:MAG: hypothetical protein RMM10_07365 [Anaerolineae bacterium]|uniref:hypothetical protein n=1 Tax=Thermoflexus sp. TaxID=1969742 RepID=UPI0025F9C681|nr:hypothetical protein [Thermoflexus sp.]MCS7351326.1 hypothetical protein [Thermoflexus sp.]MDW8180781.1 hypothetical protein [Anaerolineae bacterium]